VIRLSTARKFTFAGFALLCIAIILCGSGQLQAQDTAVVLLEPQTLSLDQGQISSVVVRIEEAANVYGVQLELSFDAGKIKVLDGDEAQTGVQITPGDFLTLDEGFVAVNEVNNETGQLSYALTLLFPAEPASDSGTLVEFEVEALETGSSDLLLGTLILASPEGAELPVRLPEVPEDDGRNNEPEATTTETAESTLTTEPALVPSPTIESTGAVAPATANPDVRSTRLPTATETPTIAAAGDLSTGAAPIQNPVEETRPAIAPTANVNPTAADPAIVEQATTEIAAAPQVQEKEDSIEVEQSTAPALTVIGKNSNVDEIPAQAVTPPSTTGNSAGVMEGTYVAIGLILLIVALIAIWFLRRLLSKS
jgi:hypothetical protein